jgi:hypothetical protein
MKKYDFILRIAKLAFIAMVTQRLLLNYPRQIMYAGVFLAVYLGDSLFTRRGKTVQYYQDYFSASVGYILLGLAAFFIDKQIYLHTGNLGSPVIPSLIVAIADKAWVTGS